MSCPRSYREVSCSRPMSTRSRHAVRLLYSHDALTDENFSACFVTESEDVGGISKSSHAFSTECARSGRRQSLGKRG